MNASGAPSAAGIFATTQQFYAGDEIRLRYTTNPAKGAVVLKIIHTSLTLGLITTNGTDTSYALNGTIGSTGVALLEAGYVDATSVLSPNLRFNLTLTCIPAPAPATLAVTGPAQSIYGEPVQFQAQASSIGGTPTGNVVFSIDGVQAAPVALTNGSATLARADIGTGNHTVTANFLGSSDYSGASATLPGGHRVNLAPTSTTLVSSLNPSSFGQTVTVTAQVAATAPSAATPTGNVVFSIDGADQPATALQGGTATFTTSSLAAGTRAITARYLGTTTHLGSNSTPLSHAVGQANTTTALAVSPNPSSFGQNIDITATVASPQGTPVGNVVFTIGGVDQAPVALSNGTASLSTSTLPAGPRTIVATYHGNGNYLGSSRSVTQQVDQANTTLVLTGPGPITYGQSAVFQAQVSSTAGTPTGTVVFTVDGNVQAPVNLIAGTASFTASGLSGGTHVIEASYSGNANFRASDGALAGGQSVTTSQTTTAITLSSPTSQFGGSVSVSAKVLSLAGTPDGTVIFSVDGVAGPEVTLASGEAAATLSGLAVGTRAITAEYRGSTNFAGSTAAAVNHTVTKAISTLVVSSTPAPTVSGQTVTFKATAASTAGTPTGSVTFSIDGNPVLPAVPLVNGEASLTSESLSVGSHAVSAEYAGSTNFLGATASLPGGHVVGQAGTTTILSASANAAAYGSSVTLEANVGAVAPGGGTPSGSVVFSLNGAPQPAQTLVGGKASLTLPALTADSYIVTAVYGGDATFLQSTGTLPGGFVVDPSETSLALTVAPEPSRFGGSATLRAELTSTAGVPTGNVEFTIDNQTPISVALRSGVATLDLPNLTTGLHGISASFPGSGNFKASASGIIQHSVGKALTVTTVATSAPTISLGGSATFTVEVTSAAGTPDGTVDLLADGAAIAQNLSLMAGRVSFTTTQLPVGNHAITAVYAGAGDYEASSGQLLGGQQVGRAATTLLVSASANPLAFGQQGTITAEITSGGGTPDGEIVFALAGSSYSVPLANGIAELTLPALEPGFYPITADYPQTASFLPTSGALSGGLTVERAAASVNLDTIPASSIYGETIGLEATVTAGVLDPSGTVTFTVDGTPQAPQPVLAGKANLDLTGLAVGNHTISAQYSGDTHIAAASNTLSGGHVVSPASSTLTLSAAPASAEFGVPITLRASVASDAGLPSGDVVFTIGGTPYPAVPLVAGEASLVVSTLTVGSHPVAASFAAQNNHGASTDSLSSPLIVTHRTTTLALSGPTGNVEVGETASFQATLGAGGLVPTGTLDFIVDGNAAAPITRPLVNGVATLIQVFTTGGTHTVEAVYAGSLEYQPARAQLSGGQSILAAATETRLSLSSASVGFGDLVSATVAVAPVSTGSGTPTGQVEFLVDGTVVGRSSLVAGSASFTLPGVGAGSHPVAARYLGTRDHAASTAASVALAVSPALTNLALSVTPNPAIADHPVTISVAATAAHGIPTGAIALTADGSALATLVLDSAGKATYAASFPAAGNVLIEADFGGSTNFAPGAATPVNLAVNAPQPNLGLLATLPDAVEGADYLGYISAVGGTGPYVITADADFPQGLILEASTGKITGRPSGSGTKTFSVSVLDSLGVSFADSFTMAVRSPLTLASPATLGSAIAGVRYESPVLTASGGTSPYTFSVAGTPDGLAFNTSTGRIEGSTVQTGTFDLVVTTSDAQGISVATTVQLVVGAPEIAVSAAAIAGEVGIPFPGITSTVSGGTAPYSFALGAAPLPPGLMLNPGSGLISGTPTAAGTYPVTITATDKNGFAGSTTLSIAVTVVPMVVLPASLPPARQGRLYLQSLSATGATSPYSYAVTGGALPSGLTLDAQSGVLSGTPTQPGQADFTITATDSSTPTPRAASVRYGFAIAAASVLTMTAPPALEAGAPGYSHFFNAQGGTGTYAYRIASGTLPQGLSFDGTTGRISGSTLITGTYGLVIEVTDTGTGDVASQAFFLRVNAPALGVAISNTNASFDTPFTATLTATGGQGGYTFSIANAPNWLTLDPATGVLSGTPDVAGNAQFTIEARDRNGFAASSLVTIVVAPPAISLGALTASTQATTRLLNATFAVSGGTGPYTFALASGTLPLGVTLAGGPAAQGTLSGIPLLVGNYTFDIKATDANGFTAQRSYTVSITSHIGNAIFPASLPAWIAGESRTASIAIISGTGAFTYSSPDLPAGLSLDANTGAITGTLSTAGDRSITVNAVSVLTGLQNSKTYVLTVVAPTFQAATTLVGGTAGTAYSASIAASGGAGGYSFSAVSGLPGGLSFDATTRTLSGTPTQAGTFAVSISVTDANGFAGTITFPLTIAAPTIGLVVPVLADAVVDAPYGPYQFGATGNGAGILTYAITGGSLPPGLTLSSTGQLSGTPTAQGTFGIEVTVKDTNGFGASLTIPLTVDSNLSTTLTLPGALQAWSFKVNESRSLAAIGTFVGTPLYTVSSGALPAGLSLNPATGAIAGAPTAAGRFSFELTVKDGPYLLAKVYDLQVIPPLLSLADAVPTAGRVGEGFSGSATAASSLTGAQFTYALSNAPPGLAIDASGAISGTPTAAGTFAMTVTATDDNGFTVSFNVTLTIAPALVPLLLPTLPQGVNGTAYSASLTPLNGAAPYVFEVSSGSLPAGLTIQSNGALSGTPTAEGTFSFAIKATDSLGSSGTRSYALTIAPAPSSPRPTTTTLSVSSQSAVVGEQVTLTAQVRTASVLPIGVVVFKSDGNLIGEALVDASGQAELVTTVRATTQNFEAVFIGDLLFGASSSLVTIALQPAQTKLEFTGDLTVNYGDPLVLVTSVSRLAPASGLPGLGNIAFFLDGTKIEDGAISNGTLTFSRRLDPGQYVLRAQYDANLPLLDLGSSAQVTVTVEASTVIGISGPATSIEGTAATFTATAGILSSGTIFPSGDVEFMAGSTSLGTKTLVNGQATLSTDALPVGDYDIAVKFARQGVFRANISALLPHRVLPAISVDVSTTTELSLSTQSPVIGQVTTMTAAVFGASALVPRGEVDFIDTLTGTVLGSATLDASGEARLDYAFFDLDPRLIRADYKGGIGFAVSFETQSVAPVAASTSVSLSASAPRSFVGEPVTLTANVARLLPAIGLPSSALVEFMADGVIIGNASTNGGNSASFTTPPLSADTVFSARYLGPLDQIDLGSLSNSLSHAVVRDDVGLVVDVTATAGNYLFDVQIAPVALQGQTPSGTLTLRHAAGLFADQTVPVSGAGGQFTVPASAFSPGVHSLSITYGGDAYFNTAVAQVSHQVLGDTTVSLALSPARPVPGSPASLLARVLSLTGGGTPTGSVLFRFASLTSSQDVSAPLNAGLATATMVFPDASDGEMTVIYSGDTTYQSNAASPLRRRIAMAAGLTGTVTTLTSSAPAVGAGEPVTFSAAVTSEDGTPDGSVAFYNGSTLLGQAPVTAGLAQWTVPGLASGTYEITASYTGNATYAASQSAILSQRVVGADGLQLVVETRPGAFVALGQRIDIVYTLTASGSVDLSGIAVSGTGVSVTCPSASLASGRTMECLGTYVISPADMQAGRVDFSGTATADGLGAVVAGATIILQAEAVAEQFATMTKDFVTTRQKLVATAMRLPDIFDRRRIVPGRRPGTVIARADGNSQVLGFTSSLAEVMSWGAAKAAENLATSVALEPLPVNVWIDAQMTLHAQDGVDTHWGDFSTLAVGVDYLLGDTALIGAVIQGDWMNDYSDKSELSGAGYLAGIYGSVALSEHLSLDANLLYGQSQNQAVATMFGQDFSGTFNTERLLANVELSGWWEYDALTIRPNLKMTLSSEDGGDYFVRTEAGDAVLVEIDRQTEFRLGLGSAFEYRLDLENGAVLTPKAALELGLSGSVLADLSRQSNLYGRATLGFGYTSENGLTLSGELGADLDASGFRSVTVRGGVGAKF